MIREIEIMELETTLEGAKYLISYTILAVGFGHFNPIAVLLILWILWFFLLWSAFFVILLCFILCILLLGLFSVNDVDYFISTL